LANLFARILFNLFACILFHLFARISVNLFARISVNLFARISVNLFAPILVIYLLVGRDVDQRIFLYLGSLILLSRTFVFEIRSIVCLNLKSFICS